MTLQIFTNHGNDHIIAISDDSEAEMEYLHLKTVSGKDSVLMWMRAKDAEKMIAEKELRSVLML